MDNIDFIEELPDTKECFNCPNCNEEYFDLNDYIFLDLEKKNLNYTVILCKNCGIRFAAYYEYNGKIKTFLNPLKAYQSKKNYDRFLNFIKKKYTHNHIIEID